MQGLGAVALAALLAEDSARAAPPGAGGSLAGLHHPAKATSVIFLYMDGGPSQVDTFDHKPALEQYHGRNPAEVFKVEPTQFNNVGKVMKSPWKFARRGQSGQWCSDLLPKMAERIDDLCLVKSMVSKFPEHTSANYFLHSGLGMLGRPSMGAWLGYGLGTANRDLPAFVVVNGGLVPPGGMECFGSGFLPAAHQASVFRPGNPPVANIAPLEGDPRLQKNKLALIRRLDDLSQTRHGPDAAVAAAIQNYETAFRMQSAVPELADLAGESRATKKLYGIDADYGPTRIFAAQCLLARRLVERGVRFVELTCPKVGGDRWDQHSNLREGHANNALAVDQPIAALLRDLQARGTLESTLVVWAGEFGRTPFAQGSDGRDHNQFAFTIWLAGAGLKRGFTFGRTDDFGYKVVEGRMEIHDLHATILHLLGIDHTKLTYRFGGRDMRLTDVHGTVFRQLFA